MKLIFLMVSIAVTVGLVCWASYMVGREMRREVRGNDYEPFYDGPHNV